MLEEKNDNLHEADGNLTNDSIESTQNDLTIAETPSISEAQELESNAIAVDNTASGTGEEFTDNEVEIENKNQKALSSIDDSNAEKVKMRR
jgi:hypothetical protein